MGKQQKNNKKGEKQVICKLKKGKITLELICRPGQIVPYRAGKIKDLDRVIMADEIFVNASKFKRAKSTDISKVTGQTDSRKAIEIILQTGEFPLTKDELNVMRADKRAQIVNHLHNNYLDPRPPQPIRHPVSRIEGVLDQMRITFDPHKSADYQFKAILAKFPEYLPIKFPVEPVSINQ